MHTFEDQGIMGNHRSQRSHSTLDRIYWTGRFSVFEMVSLDLSCTMLLLLLSLLNLVSDAGIISRLNLLELVPREAASSTL